jgi:hypothetical protein
MLLFARGVILRMRMFPLFTSALMASKSDKPRLEVLNLALLFFLPFSVPLLSWICGIFLRSANHSSHSATLQRFSS